MGDEDSASDEQASAQLDVEDVARSVPEQADDAAPATDAPTAEHAARRLGAYIVEREVARDGARWFVAALADDAAGAENLPLDADRVLIAPLTAEARADCEHVVALHLRHPRVFAPAATFEADGATYVALAGPEHVAVDEAATDVNFRALPVDAVPRAGIGLADALGYLHRNGVAHLHIGPDTLLVLDGRAYFVGLERATLSGTDQESSRPLFARDANFLARSLDALGGIGEEEQPSDTPVVRALREIVARGASGGFATAEEVESACGRAALAVQHGSGELPPIETPTGLALAVRAASATSVGRVRSENQDATGIFVYDLRDDASREVTPLGVFVLADGMGGEARGEVASRIGVRMTTAEMARHFALPAVTLPAISFAAAHHGAPTDLAKALEGAVIAANKQVRALGEYLGEATGSTLTAIAIAGDRAVVAHVGDSRAYLLRGDMLTQLTEDHSLLARLQVMDHPLLSDPSFGVTRSYLYRSLGQDDETPPDLHEFALSAGDRLLLCSDGLWDELDAQTIGAVLAQAYTPEQCANALVQLANEAGGHDNCTAVAVFVDGLAPEILPPATERTEWDTPDTALAEDEHTDTADAAAPEAEHPATGGDEEHAAMPEGQHDTAAGGASDDEEHVPDEGAS